MTWTSRRVLFAGLALIVGTNAVVLAGAAYNRGGEPEAQLRLTERELSAPHSWGFESENSGLAMQLQWRVTTLRSIADDTIDYGHARYGGEVEWLDTAKLIELGFDASQIDRVDDGRHTDTLPRDVFLVLELDGPAYRIGLKRAEEIAARQEALASANPADSQIKNRAEYAKKARDASRHRHSRLYVVDAGLDHQALRAKYPDRTRYAVVGGQVRIYRWRHDNVRKDQPRGYVSEVNVDTINVPLHLRSVLARGAGFEAVVHYGRRLEPWFVSGTSRSKPHPDPD